MEKDWILDNIKRVLAEKQIKVETVSNEIGISKGEFSKILSGQRKDYFKYLPQIAESIETTFHELVTPPHIVQNNHVDEVNANGVGNAGNVYQQNNIELYERIISECEEKDKAKDMLIEQLRTELDNFKRKYQNAKDKVKEFEKGKLSN
jgi:DNA-binding Xre family transcriptional regulator